MGIVEEFASSQKGAHSVLYGEVGFWLGYTDHFGYAFGLAFRAVVVRHR